MVVNRPKLLLRKWILIIKLTFVGWSTEQKIGFPTASTPLQAAAVRLHKCGKVLRSKITLVQMSSSPANAVSELSKLVMCFFHTFWNFLRSEF